MGQTMGDEEEALERFQIPNIKLTSEIFLPSDQDGALIIKAILRASEGPLGLVRSERVITALQNALLHRAGTQMAEERHREPIGL
jgi:hypothetical protein